jgi:PAS domain S-box-containing protein
MSPIALIRNSVRSKLLAVVVLTAVTALVIAGTWLVLHDLKTYENSRAGNLTTIAEVVAAASGPALLFDDRRAAEANLGLLRVRPSILAAAFYRPNGELFASYSPEQLEVANLLGDLRRGYVIEGDRIALVQPVMEKSEEVGFLYIVGRYESRERLLDTAGIVSIVLLLSLLAAVLASTWLQRNLTTPISDMTDAARRVREERDFSIRVRKSSDDEIGYLVDTFNAMLDEVGRRSEELMQSNRALTREIAERREAEDARLESEGRFRVLADDAPVLIWINEPHGCVFVNREYLHYTGQAFERLADMGWTDVIHPDDLDATIRSYRKSLENHSRYEVEHRIRRADGAYRWFKSVGTPRLRADGRLMHYVGCSFDINEIKENIVELDAAHGALREADRKKDEFLAVLSHELRNPLNPVRNAAAVLRLSSERSQVIWAAEVIDRQSRQLARLLDDLLDAARITQGKLALRKQRVALSAIVAMAVETTRSLFEANDQKLDITLPADTIYLEADTSRMSQVLGNVLNNAAKYTDRGGHIRLTAARKDGRVSISIRDSGSGIAAADLPHVFDLFMQARAHSARAAGGLGIGLALVKILVEMHGGTVEARSDGPGTGSEFVIALPADTEAASTSREPGAASYPVAIRGLKVLVADDVADSVQSLAMVLRALKHEVHVANDGSEALEVARRVQPDVAILDIGMPGLTGYEVATRIRLHAWGRKVMLIALTGWGQNRDLTLAQEAGFDRHMTKPADSALLARYLAEAAARGRES